MSKSKINMVVVDFNMMYVHHLEVSQKKWGIKGSNSADISYTLIMELWKLFQINQKINYAWLSESKL
jgi:hypothetical protein